MLSVAQTSAAAFLRRLVTSRVFCMGSCVEDRTRCGGGSKAHTWIRDVATRFVPATLIRISSYAMFRDPRLGRMARFLASIGINMRPGRVEGPTVFPGSLILRGTLQIDEARLVAPGDALHEAAHI